MLVAGARAGRPWTQHKVYANQPSVCGHRASRRQEAASSLGSRRGDHSCSHYLAAGAGDPRQGAAVGMGADTLAAQHGASDMQARTAGDGAPPLRSSILYHIAADWEEFADIRAAARALSQKSRLRNALSTAVNSVRVELAAAALCADRSASPATVLSREDELHRLDTIGRALRLHAHARAVLVDCVGPLTSDWFLSPPQVQAVMEALGSVVGGGSNTTSAAPSPALT